MKDEEDDDWIEFGKWFKDNETRFHQGQFSDKEIGYAAWLEGIKTCQRNLRGH